MTKRRLALLVMLTLAVSGIKGTEGVLAKDSGPVDAAVLWFIQAHVAAALKGCLQCSPSVALRAVWFRQVSW